MKLRDYLLENGVIVTDRAFRSAKEYKDEDILKQIILIRNLHNILMRYSIYETTRINSTIGKQIESIKVELKKCRMNLNEIYCKNEKNTMDKFLLSHGDLVLKSAQNAIISLKEIDYIGIIKRSMKKNEICLGRVDEGNLRAYEGIEIGSIKDISYNLVEDDIYNYLRKVRRKSPRKNNLKMHISKYIDDVFLGENSREYLLILLSIPLDTIKNWRKYRLNKRQLSTKDHTNNIIKSMKYEMGYKEEEL